MNKYTIHKKHIRSLIEKHMPTGTVWDRISDKVFVEAGRDVWGDERVHMEVVSASKIDSIELTVTLEE